jgi:hypothetical protein
MTPIRRVPQLVSNCSKFLDRHFRQLIVIDECSAASGTAPDDVTGRWLVAIFSVDAMCQIDCSPE